MAAQGLIEILTHWLTSLSGLEDEPGNYQERQPEPPETSEHPPQGRKQYSVRWAHAKPEQAEEGAHKDSSFQVCPLLALGRAEIERLVPVRLLCPLVFRAESLVHRYRAPDRPNQRDVHEELKISLSDQR